MSTLVINGRDPRVIVNGADPRVVINGLDWNAVFNGDAAPILNGNVPVETSDYLIPYQTINTPRRGRATLGDGTFTRAGNVTFVDDTGAIQTAGANARAFELVGGKRAGRNIPVFTNLMPYSEDFAGNWTDSGIAAVADVTGPDGGANSATTITGDNGDTTEYTNLAFNPAADNEIYVADVYVKEGTSEWLTVLVQDTGAPATRAEVDFQWVAGALTVGAEDTGTGAVEQLKDSPFWRAVVYVPVNTIVEANTHEMWLYPTRNGVQAATNTIFFGAQLVQHPQPVPYIPTSGAAASNTTEAGFPHYALPTGPSGETLFAEALGAELTTGTSGAFGADQITKAGAKVISGITKADPGVVTFAAGHGYVDGQVIFIEALDEMTELNDEYWKIRSVSGDTCELSDAAIGTWDSSSLDTSGFGNAETTGGTAKATSFTNWTEGLGWHPGVDGAGALTGTADCDGEQSGAVNLAQSGILTLSVTNKLVYTLSNRAAGTIDIILGSGATTGAESSDATYTKYKETGTSQNMNIQASITFIGSIDDVSVKQVTNAWDGKPPHFTMVLWARFGYSESEMPNDSKSGILHLQDHVDSLLKARVAGDGSARIQSTDSAATTAQTLLNWLAYAWYKIAVQVDINSNVYQFRVGAEAEDSTFDAASWGVWVDFDGAFTTGGSLLQLGYGLFGQMHIADLRFFTRVLSDGEINAL